MSISTAAGGPSLWQRLDAMSPPKERGFALPTSAPEYTWTERVRDAPAVRDGFDGINRRARWLREQRGSGFEYAWRGTGDVLLSPTWLTFRSARFDPERGRVVAAGRLTHEMLGMPPAHDLGAIDGRNGGTFTDAGHGGGLFMPSDWLYVGSLRSGALVPIDATRDVCAVDLDPVGEGFAVLDTLGASTGAVSVFSPSGERRLLTVIGQQFGNESIEYNGDGTWLLVSRSRESILIEVATGRTLTLPMGNTGWWTVDPSTLLTIEHEDGRATPRLFSLEANGFVRDFPAIALDIPLLETFPYLWSPAVSPDGTELLASTPAGVTPEFQQEHGVGDRGARVRLADGSGQLVHSVFLDDDQSLEREVKHLAWSGARPAVGVRLHPDLEASLEGPVIEHDWLALGRWADEAERILIPTLNVAIGLAQEEREVGHLFPEIVAALVPIGHDPSIWSRQKEWLSGLALATMRMRLEGTIVGPSSDAWSRFGHAIGAIDSGQPERIDVLGSA